VALYIYINLLSALKFTYSRYSLEKILKFIKYIKINGLNFYIIVIIVISYLFKRSGVKYYNKYTKFLFRKRFIKIVISKYKVIDDFLIYKTIGKSGKTVLQNRYLIGAKCVFCSLGKSWRQDF